MSNDSENDPKAHLKLSPGRPKGTPSLGTKGYNRFDLPRKKRFLKKLEASGSLTEAAAAVGVARNTIYKAMDKDEKFKARVEIARERATANLEVELNDRIYKGNEKLEYDADGKLVRKTVTKDNNLLSRALEANMPEKYGKKNDTNVQVNVVGDSAINKLAAFLKVDLPEKDEEKKDGTIDADWEEM